MLSPEVGDDDEIALGMGSFRCLDDWGSTMALWIILESLWGIYCPAGKWAYCCTVEHSRLVAERFVEAGWRAAHVDGDTPAGHRLAAVEALARGELDVLTNCYLFTEGVDLPALGAFILLRPTQSVALYLQRVGRALRAELGEEKALVFDHAGNVWRHGLCDEPRQWSLRSKRRRSAGAALVKEFPDCHSMVEIGTGTCPEYGFVFAAGLQRRNPVVIAGVLDQVTIADRLRRMSYGRAVRWAGADSDRLSWVAKARGYRLVWIWHRSREQARTEP